jgi:DNA-binding transcriptional LysR family regulator
LNSQHIDLVTAKIDVAIRIGTLRDSGLVARLIGDIRLSLFASPAYVQSDGLPEQPSALDQHEIIDGTSASIDCSKNAGA